jgi:hypothetical protein
MKEFKKQKFEGSGGIPLKQKVRLMKGTRFVSVLFIAVSILISAGIMKAANVYYDLDSSRIMVNDEQRTTDGLVVSGAAGTSLSGTGSTTATSTTLTGNASALFNTELVVGDRITVGTETRVVATITDFNTLDVTIPFTVSDSGLSMTKLPIVFGIADSTGNYATYFQGGTQSSNAIYTLPTSNATGTDYVLVSDPSGKWNGK